MPRLTATVVVVTIALAFVPTAVGHAERPTQFPDPHAGRVPTLRSGGPALVVCKQDSRDRIMRSLDGDLKQKNLALLDQCRFRHIQEAVNAADNRTRILVLPGVYHEETSRQEPYPDPACSHLMVRAAAGPLMVPSYEYQRRCPNSQNLIAIIGDSDDDGRCDTKCGLQIEGTGADPSQVIISGGTEKPKLNTIRADRADGIVLRNFTVEYSDFNNVYVLETNGFRFDRIVSRWSKEYGFLSFTSDHGLYENLVTYGAGDAGIYPGSSPQGRCARYGIEIRNVDSYGNVFGLSGNAGNSIWVHDSRFHDNATGLLVGSLGPGHPGQPQNCAKFERNQINSNNADFYDPERDRYCLQPIASRDLKTVCPTAPAPVGTGIFILGGNRNLIRNNLIYDNWRTGARLGWAPVQDRPAGTVLGLRSLGLIGRNAAEIARMRTSHGNRFIANSVGVQPDGQSRPNGLDFQWDGEGRRNCWSENRGPSNAPVPTTQPSRLDRCPGQRRSIPVRPQAIAELVACAQWTQENRDPSRCDWLSRPAMPLSAGTEPASGVPWKKLALVALGLMALLSLVGFLIYRLKTRSRPAT